MALAVFLWGIAFCPAVSAADAPVPQQKLIRGHWSENKEIMQKNHQDLLKGRMNAEYPLDMTQKNISIEQCVTCHVQRGQDNMPVSADNANHFCRECHTFNKVSVNCFQCHASLPASDPYAMDRSVKNSETIKARLQQWQDYNKGGKR